MAYTKLFNSLVTSTIWSEDDRTRIVWITMLALADKNGEVQGSIPGLARIAGVPVDDCRAAIAKFLAPDLDSRTKDDEGRRIEEIDGGWHLLNHQKYRDMATDEHRKSQAAIRQKRAREKKSRNNHASLDSHATVTQESLQIPQAEAEAEAEAVLLSPHTHQARGAQEQEYWPDPREYPTVETVKQWAEQVMVSPACAEKWHATRVSENWETRNHRPLQLDSLPALFRTYATAWKSREAQVGKPNGYTNKPRNQALQRDVTAGKTAAQIGDIFADHS
jgi:hypothetical protein